MSGALSCVFHRLEGQISESGIILSDGARGGCQCYFSLGSVTRL
jgi:hypothetical protein